MAPIWPFKKKEPIAQVEEAPPAAIIYRKGEDPNARPQQDEVDSSAYKDALALFGGGSSTVEAATDQSVRYDGVTSPQPEPSVSEPSLVEEAPEFTWVHHTDGYHYKRKASGEFEPTPHTKSGDGIYTPYS
jgi:hypothetical protein